MVKVGDKFGSVFELLSAKSLTKLIVAEPENKDKYIKIFADLLKEIHETEVKEGLLPSNKQTALGWAKWLEEHIPAETYQKLYRLIDEIPESNHMLHGDYHTNNVHYAGNPIFEFASIYLAYRGYGEVDKSMVEDFLKLDFETAGYILKKLFDFYFEGKDEAYKEKVLDNAKVIAYTRALRRTIKRLPERTDMIELYRKELIEYTDKAESLAI